MSCSASAMWMPPFVLYEYDGGVSMYLPVPLGAMNVQLIMEALGGGGLEYGWGSAGRGQYGKRPPAAAGSHRQLLRQAKLSHLNSRFSPAPSLCKGVGFQNSLAGQAAEWSTI